LWREVPTARSAVVCVLFVPAPNKNDSDFIVLTRRTTSVNTHKGQISFPGGRTESHDNGPADTARREVEEELGVNADHIHIIGSLPITQSLDGAVISPVVAYADYPANLLRAADGEVAEIILVPWRELQREKSEPFSFNIFGTWRTSNLFRVEPHLIWGLTANILADADLKL